MTRSGSSLSRFPSRTYPVTAARPSRVKAPVDHLLRKLTRDAADDPAKAEALAQALARIGREALRYTGPQPPPEQEHRASRQVDRAEATAAEATCWWGQPTTRIQAEARKFTKRRSRRARRRARKTLTRDWDLWD